MNLHLEILPKSQKEIWKELDAVPKHFVLYGGTALALRLGHRTSVDFDFFTAEPFDTDKFQASLPFAKNCEILQSSANTLTLLVERGGPVKISFFGNLTLCQIAAPDIAPGNGIRIASINDIFATKLRVILQRSEAKDYIDIAEILKSGVSLETGLGCRPVSLNSYKKHGLLLCDPARLQAEARNIFGDSEMLEAAFKDLRENSSYSSYEEHNCGKIFFCLTMEELVEECGHYLLYGSEYINAVSVRLNKQEMLRKIGKATIIECRIPSGFMEPDYWKCLAGAVIEDIFETVLEPEYVQGMNNFGFPIYSALPPEAIVRFHHPTRIPNPYKLRMREK